MRRFSGFAAGKTRFTPIPDQFYSELLVEIDDLAELKLVLYLFWALHRQRGYPRYLTRGELESEGLLLAALHPEGGEAALGELARALELAEAHGIALRLKVADEAGEIEYWLLNTPQGRKAVRQVREGSLVLERPGYVREPRPSGQRPNIYALYEQNIGLLQPLLADELREAEDTYPQEWIVDAFRLAAEQNVRNWKYVRRILDRWATEGRDGESQRNAGAAGGRWRRVGR